VVVGGSHGKTTTTAMIMHALRHAGVDFDYMVGAQVEGFEAMVHLSETAQVAVFEGDEYPASPLDSRPKFHLYHPHVAIITGVAWDHANVFPTRETDAAQFLEFAKLIEGGGTLIYFEGDRICRAIAARTARAVPPVRTVGYSAHPHEDSSSAGGGNACRLLLPDGGSAPLKVFGAHNLQNLSAAMLACQQVGLPPEAFYAAIGTFGGAARRLQLLAANEQEDVSVLYDFAHSPSKLRATIKAVRKYYPRRKLYACIELHTYSSLNKIFLPEYFGGLRATHAGIVYFNPAAVARKELPVLSTREVEAAFGCPTQAIDDAGDLLAALRELPRKQATFLLMSSGDFGGIDVPALAQELVTPKPPKPRKVAPHWSTRRGTPGGKQ
jgi:UDP-N-acetylmuramate: L-alanyl-gamma-D-glutamyl-meso-diaminopimelate ligase